MERLSIAYTDQQGVYAIAADQECLAIFSQKTDGFAMLMELVYMERITITEATILANHIYDVAEIPSSGEMYVTKIPSEDGLAITTETMSFDLKYLNTIILYNELWKMYGHLTEFPAVLQCQECIRCPHAQIIFCAPHLERHGENDFCLKFELSPEFSYRNQGIKIVKDLYERGDLNDTECNMLIQKIYNLNIPGTEIEQLN